jgi:hypothetical protein
LVRARPVADISAITGFQLPGLLKEWPISAIPAPRLIR